MMIHNNQSVTQVIMPKKSVNFCNLNNELVNLTLKLLVAQTSIQSAWPKGKKWLFKSAIYIVILYASVSCTSALYAWKVRLYIENIGSHSNSALFLSLHQGNALHGATDGKGAKTGNKENSGVSDMFLRIVKFFTNTIIRESVDSLYVGMALTRKCRITSP